ncbi:MAG: hypothetical protein QF619_14225, partial [Candidatus Binatia bacterium]|nr:hypothetical protein [Candidatus Binatia bacterium]
MWIHGGTGNGGLNVGRPSCGPRDFARRIAFWADHYACEKIGCEVIPGGGLSTQDRILKMKEIRATALMCTPTYALHM